MLAAQISFRHSNALVYVFFTGCSQDWNFLFFYFVSIRIDIMLKGEENYVGILKIYILFSAASRRWNVGFLWGQKCRVRGCCAYDNRRDVEKLRKCSISRFVETISLETRPTNAKGLICVPENEIEVYHFLFSSRMNYMAYMICERSARIRD